MILDVLLWVAACLWTLLFVQLLLNWWLAPDLRRLEVDPGSDWPAVSIVVPARDEEDGIGAAVTSFCGQDYPALEVIVVDDGSTDRTAEILAELKQRHANLTVLRASEPPPGWMGKVNALETGRRAATGQWLLFVDADVVYAPELVRRAVTLARRERAGMVVASPHFVTGGLLEAVIMSHLYLLAAAVVPAFLVSRTRSRVFALGGGVFNMVHRDALQACGAFASLRGEVADDVALGVHVKGAGFRVVPTVAGDMVSVRMYRGAWNTVRGFTKNVYPAVARTSRLLLLLPPVLGAVLHLLPYYGLVRGLISSSPVLPAAISLGLMHATLGCIALFFRQPLLIAFLNPLRELLWWLILARGWLRYRRRGVVWRGRTYPVSKAG